MAYLLGRRNELDHLLKSTSAMLVQSNGHQRGSCVANKGVALLVIGELEQLLAEIVAEGVYER